MMQVVNPNSGEVVQVSMTDIIIFCRDNVHGNDFQQWLDVAMRAYNEGDAQAVGRMIFDRISILDD